MTTTARDTLIEIYRDWFNKYAYVTTATYAKHNGLTPEQGAALINLAREVARSEHPEA